MNKKKIEKILKKALANKDLLEVISQALLVDENIKISNLIFETKNYDKIKKLSGNREVDKNNVKNIKKSIEKNGYKKSKPISIDKNLEIIDGQHRKEACKELNISVPFMIETNHNDSLKLTQDLNSNQKNWKITDFINSYADRGFEDYILFNNFLKDENISSSLLIWLLYHSRSGEVQLDIKTGKLTCTEKQLVEIKKTINKAKEIRSMIPYNSVQYKNFMKDKVLIPLILIMNQKSYNHSRMIKQIQEEYFSLDMSNMSNAGTSLVNIYNKRLSKQNKLPDYNRI